jgi:hypothetical protein
MRNRIVTALLVLLGLAANAQYKQAFGVKAAFESGVTYKKFIKEEVALEFILGVFKGGAELYGLYEIHQNLSVEELKFYYGLGAHVGVGARRGRIRTQNDIAIGGDAIAGVEYKIPEVPFALSLDIKPELNVLPDVHFWFGGGFGVKYLVK